MWEYIRPETVAKYVRFKREDENWQYDPKNGDMYTKQTEGVAFLWNCLRENDIALLADEVGMGKTLQALSVVALLLHQKPDARVLVIAPRSVVAENWISEYHTFIAQHYIKEGNTGNIVCTEIGGDPIHPAQHCNNLETLFTLYRKCWPHFFIIRTSSLSGLVNDSGENHKQEKAFEAAKNIREDLYKAKAQFTTNASKVNETPFDLLIIDEAHYFRTKYGGSQKVGAAQAFFGAEKLYDEESAEKKSKWRPIADKTLLLTATPNHSNEKDIENIFSYFPHRLDLPSDNRNRSKEILNSAALRRFRRFEKKTKYHYREESTLPASFLDPKDITSEIFFALYQKRLARISEYEKKRFLHGYLEGFEAIPEYTKHEIPESKKENDKGNFDDENQTDSGDSGKTTDYTRSEYDSAIIEDLLQKFRETHGKDEVLRHPKYDKLVKDVSEKTLNKNGDIEKAVVFVRRIPSTKEISRRINREYDEYFCSRLAGAYGINVVNERSLHDNLRQIDNKAKNHILNNIKDDATDGISEEENVDTEEERKDFQRSIVLDMFKIRKNTAQESDTWTHSYLFNQIQSFRKKCVNRKSIFSLMFHPPADYEKKPYKFTSSDIMEKDGDVDYEGSAFWIRKNYKGTKKTDVWNSLLDGHWNIEKVPGQNTAGTGRRESIYDKELETMLTAFIKAAEQKNDDEKIDKHIKNYTIIQMESLCRFVRQGLLNASGVIVDLFVYYVEVCNAFKNKNLNLIQIDIYQKFFELLLEEMKKPKSLLYSLIKQSLELFQVIQTKEMSLHNEEDLLKIAYWRWNIFNNQSPSYGFSGDTKNESVLPAFNTPFFPNVLVATSVLQEGVNLHMFCNTVYHYGIAWSAGDNEQRIGRVDRFFGKAHREIIGGTDGRVTSSYPYLERTLDETQLSNFVRKKYRAEKLLDQCMLDDSSTEIQTDESRNWKADYLLQRKGENQINEKKNYEDPYPAISDKQNRQRKWKQDEFEKGISPLGRNVSVKDIRKTINEFAENIATKYSASFYKTDDSEIRTICAIEPDIIVTGSVGKRSQPIFFRITYQPEVSGIDEGTIYLLSLISPLANKETYDKWNLENLYKKGVKLQEEYPGVQVSLDTSVPEQSHFFLSTRIDLPIFLDEDSISFLSYTEVELFFHSIFHFSDALELFASMDVEEQNLTIEKDLKPVHENQIKINEASPMKHDFYKNDYNIENKFSVKRWNLLKTSYGKYYSWGEKCSETYKEIEKIFELNNKYPFVFFENYENKKGVEVKFVYPAGDFQERERVLLEKCARYVIYCEKTME